MRGIPYTADQFRKETKRPYNKNMEFVEKFYNSDDKIMEVVDYSHKNAKSCGGGLYSALKKLRLDDRIKVRVIQERVWLIKK